MQHRLQVLLQSLLLLGRDLVVCRCDRRPKTEQHCGRVVGIAGGLIRPREPEHGGAVGTRKIGAAVAHVGLDTVAQPREEPGQHACFLLREAALVSGRKAADQLGRLHDRDPVCAHSSLDRPNERLGLAPHAAPDQLRWQKSQRGWTRPVFVAADPAAVAVEFVAYCVGKLLEPVEGGPETRDVREIGQVQRNLVRESGARGPVACR